MPIDAKAGSTVVDVRHWSDTHAVTLLGIRTGDRVQLNPEVDTLVTNDDAAIVVSRTRPDPIVL